MEAKMYEDAVVTFKTTVSKWPHSLRALQGLAKALHAAGRYEEARDQYEVALKVTYWWQWCWGAPGGGGGLPLHVGARV